MFSLAFIRDNFTFILSALPVTLTITLLSLLFSTLLGAALAWAIIRQVPGVQWLARVFLSFGRSVPVLVMLYFFLRLAVDCRRAVRRPAGHDVPL
jgi:L-cystine transport system permease protein